MKEKNIFWGIFFIVMAGIVIASKVGDLTDVGVFSIMASVVLLWIIVDGIRHKNCYKIIFTSAFLVILHEDTLGIEGLSGA